jgi:hypothetical protein
VAWDAALTTIESRIEATASGLASGTLRAEPTEFVAPDVSGPVPAALEARAQAILERAAAVRRELEVEMGRVQDELRRIPRRSGRPPTSPFAEPDGAGRVDVEA